MINTWFYFWRRLMVITHMLPFADGRVPAEQRRIDAGYCLDRYDGYLGDLIGDPT
jgi:hypothetical protein